MNVKRLLSQISASVAAAREAAAEFADSQAAMRSAAVPVGPGIANAPVRPVPWPPIRSTSLVRAA